MALIRSLPEEFNNFRSSLLLVPGSLDLKTVKEAFLQEERNRAPRASEQMAMKASTSSFSKRQGRKVVSTPCTYPSCRKPSSHTLENCFKRMEDALAKRDSLRKPRTQTQANQADNSSPALSSAPQAAEFAGNASALDFTHPCSPLICNAGADWIADTGATSHMTPHRH